MNNNDYDDFTESHYRSLLACAVKQGYAFERFGTVSKERHVLWRHDIDHSPQRALALARIEAEAGVRATFFVLLHGIFYNALEAAVVECLGEIRKLGHDFGLHFDPGFYANAGEAINLQEQVAWERAILERVLGVELRAVSFHNPTLCRGTESEDLLAGLVNTYGKPIQSRYSYCSDSNGIWRHRRLWDVLAEGREKYLHVLTHPDWWVATPMSPRDRVRRCIEGRARRVMEAYEDMLAQAGRPNVGDNP